VNVDLHLDKPNKWSRSNVYFLWEILMPMFDLVISRPKKYVVEPRSLIGKNWFNTRLNVVIVERQLPTMSISSTYSNMIVKVLVV